MDALERVPLWRSFAVRVFAPPVIVAISLVALATAWLHADSKDVVVERCGQALESTAATAAPFIDAADVAAIRGPDDVDTPAFRRLRRTLEQIRAENDLQEDQVYILRHGENSELTFVAMLQKKTFVGDTYRPPPELHTAYRWVGAENDAMRTGLYTSPNGRYISGIAPIVGEDGSVVGILQVDYGVDRVLGEVAARTEIIAAGGLALVLVILALGLGVHFWVRRRVRVLLAGTTAIAREDYEQNLRIIGNDELSAVAVALNGALGKLRERFEMLKFIPSHTAKMIASSSGPIDLFKSRRVRVVVLETDIRSFTRMTASMSSEQIIAMLNVCMSSQAALVTEYGGSIDKYMGDALLAVFEGEDMERKAVNCAIAIQQSLAAMNDSGVFQSPVHIGIGVSVGEVVMGNMGSKDRMEHTVIGTVVNLAARLASEARAGEVLLSGDLADALPETARVGFGEAERLQVKGFDDPVPCHRLAVNPRQ